MRARRSAGRRRATARGLLAPLAALAPACAPSAPPAEGVPVGARLDPLPLLEDARPLVWAPEPGRPALLFTFSLGCGRCEEIAPRWKELLSVVGAPEEGGLPVEVAFLTRDDLAGARAFLAEHGLEGRLFFAAALPAPWEERLAPVPQTVLVDAGGRVARAAVGAWDPEERVAWWDALARSFDRPREGAAR